jgi:hypothetical protein
VQARAYPFTQASKAALINNLTLMLERKEITLPRPELCPELVEELEAFEFSVTEAGNVRTGSPSGMHDDCVVALALAAWDSRLLVSEVQIARGPGSQYQVGSQIWT